MYPHFIEVHDIRKPEDAMLVNIKAIKHIYFEPETNSGAISLVDKVFVPTKESYDELKELITNAGCHIEKGDPRLDTSHPLSLKPLSFALAVIILAKSMTKKSIAVTDGRRLSGRRLKICHPQSQSGSGYLSVRNCRKKENQ